MRITIRDDRARMVLKKKRPNSEISYLLWWLIDKGSTIWVLLDGLTVTVVLSFFINSDDKKFQ